MGNNEKHEHCQSGFFMEINHLKSIAADSNFVILWRKAKA